MKRFCNGQDPNLVQEDGVTPCDCGSIFDDVDWTVVYPHQKVHGTETLKQPRRLAEGKRTKVLTVSAEMFVEMFLSLQKGEWVGVEGIPLDIRVLNAYYDLPTMCFKILVESQEWEVIPPYAVSPEFSPIFYSYSTKGWASKDPDPLRDMKMPTVGEYR